MKAINFEINSNQNEIPNGTLQPDTDCSLIPPPLRRLKWKESITIKLILTKFELGSTGMFQTNLETVRLFPETFYQGNPLGGEDKTSPPRRAYTNCVDEFYLDTVVFAQSMDCHENDPSFDYA